MDSVDIFNTKSTRTLPNLRPGLTIKIHQRIKEGTKTRTQIFEGIVIAHKHGTGPNGTITVRKIAHGVGVERIFPLHLPTVEKFEIVRANKVRRAKLYYLRRKTARETKRKIKAISLPTSTAPSIEHTSAQN